MFRRIDRAAAVLCILPSIAAANSGLIRVTGIRSWSHSDSTRVVIETTGAFEFRADRAANPDRLFFDIAHARISVEGRPSATRVVNDALVKRVRVAQLAPGTARVVFELTGPVECTVSRLNTPDRMVIEIRPARHDLRVSPAPPPVYSTGVRPVHPAFIYPPAPPRPPLRSVVLAPNPPSVTVRPVRAETLLAITLPPPHGRVTAVVAAKASPTPVATPRAVAYDAAPVPSDNATRSLTRALGLKVNRIVIDAGHGGHDDGTMGPNGVLEKDVVLDVALRLAKLVESRMGIEVVLTRSDDTFIPLHERTEIANRHNADLFLSIHANSSPSPVVAGTETFFLNFTNSPSALDVASRENAGADKNVGELKTLIESITLNDKIAESQTFAQNIQNAIFSQAAKSNVAARNRGVKRAPFVVLIGASMPSVLAEIGFLSNARDEANLGKPEYRQKIAESLYKGLSQYAQSLSHFEMARGVDRSDKPVGAGIGQ
jgi:N-acetylmuramoyl-L-alanine amidase